MMKINVDKIYICHWSKLTDRKNFILKHLSENNLDNFEFVETYDKDSWDKELIEIEYPNIFNVYNSYGYNEPRKLKLSEISLVLKHCWIIKESKKHNYDSIMVLEDDALLVDNFVEKFNSYKNELPPDWDCAWIGSCCNLHAYPIIENKHIYEVPGSRCTHAYLLSKKCINTVYNTIKYVDNCSDFYYNYLIDRFKLKNYWFEPELATQNQIFHTTIQI